MRYVLKQKIWSIADSFTIKDDRQEDVYYVKGRVFSLGHVLSFRDRQDNELAVIQQKALSLGPVYEILRDGQLTAVVKKKLFTLFRAHFTVDVPDSDSELVAEGTFLDREYAISRDGRLVARVSRQWFTLGDTYGVEVAEEEDDVLMLCCAVVIDMACHLGGDT